MYPTRFGVKFPEIYSVKLIKVSGRRHNQRRSLDELCPPYLFRIAQLAEHRQIKWSGIFNADTLHKNETLILIAITPHLINVWIRNLKHHLKEMNVSG